MVVNEVITLFSFKGSLKPQETFNANLGQSIKLTAGLAAGVLAAGAAVTGYASSILETLDPLVDLSQQTGISAGALQELGYAASVSGSSAQDMQASLSGLSSKIGEAALKGNEMFMRLGINVRDASGKVKSADQVLMELGGRFKSLNISLAEQRSIAQALGISPSLLQMLNKSGGEIDAMRERARKFGVLTNAQAAAVDSYNDSLTTLRFGLDALKQAFAVGLAPQMQAATDRFADFLAQNKDLIINGLAKLTEGLFVMIDAVGRLMPVLAALGAVMIVLRVRAMGFAAAFALANLPIILIVAGIAAVLLIIDDLMVAMNGGKSVIADFFQEFFNVDIVASIKKWYGAFMDAITSIQTAMKDIIPAWLENGFEAFVKVAAAFIPSGDPTDTAGGGALGALMGAGPAAVARATAGAGAGTTNNQVNQQVNVEIKTNDPQAAGQAVNDVLNEQMRDASAQFNRGGK